MRKSYKRTSESLTPIIGQVSIEIADEHPPNWRTLYRWLYDYERSGQDIRSLVPRHSAKWNRHQLDSEVRRIIDTAIKSVYLTLSRPDIADVYDEV